MVGALEMAKPLILQAQAAPEGETGRRGFADVIDHALVIADAALAVQVFEMQMLRDAYLIRGVLHALRSLLGDDKDGPVPHSSVLDVVKPVLNGLLDADDRFFSRLPAISRVQGVGERTILERLAD